MIKKKHIIIAGVIILVVAALLLLYNTFTKTDSEKVAEELGIPLDDSITGNVVHYSGDPVTRESLAEGVAVERGRNSMYWPNELIGNPSPEDAFGDLLNDQNWVAARKGNVYHFWFDPSSAIYANYYENYNIQRLEEINPGELVYFESKAAGTLTYEEFPILRLPDGTMARIDQSVIVYPSGNLEALYGGRPNGTESNIYYCNSTGNYGRNEYDGYIHELTNLDSVEGEFSNYKISFEESEDLWNSTNTGWLGATANVQNAKVLVLESLSGDISYNGIELSYPEAISNKIYLRWVTNNTYTEVDPRWNGGLEVFYSDSSRNISNGTVTRFHRLIPSRQYQGDIPRTRIATLVANNNGASLMVRVDGGNLFLSIEDDYGTEVIRVDIGGERLTANGGSLRWFGGDNEAIDREDGLLNDLYLVNIPKGNEENTLLTDNGVIIYTPNSDLDNDELYFDVSECTGRYLPLGAWEVSMGIGESLAYQGRVITLDDVFPNDVQVNGELIASGSQKRIGDFYVRVDAIGYHSNSPELSKAILTFNLAPLSSYTGFGNSGSSGSSSSSGGGSGSSGNTTSSSSSSSSSSGGGSYGNTTNSS